MQHPVEVDMTAHAALSLLALFADVAPQQPPVPAPLGLKRKADDEVVITSVSSEEDPAYQSEADDGAGSDEYRSAPGSPKDDDDFSPYQASQYRKSSSTNPNSSSRKRPAKEPKGPMRFVCDQCGYATNHNWLLKRHHLTHSGEKPYVCTVCSKAFRQSAHLSGHMKIHTGEKSWLCSDCGESFKRSDTLQKHRLTHLKKHSSSSSRDRSLSPSGSPPAPSSPVGHPDVSA